MLTQNVTDDQCFNDFMYRHTLAGVIARLKVRQAQIEISGLMKGKQNDIRAN